MRIVAGAAKGRSLRTPRSGTRPLTGRAREALFSSLGNLVVGARVLDLFAGSGSLGLEALSRGAAGVVFVERDRGALEALRANVDAVDLGGEIVAADVTSFVHGDDRRYDIVFVDPPFAMESAPVDAVLEAVGAHIEPGAAVVVHRRVGTQSPQVDFPADVTVRRYGDSQLYVFRRIG